MFPPVVSFSMPILFGSICLGSLMLWMCVCVCASVFFFLVRWTLLRPYPFSHHLGPNLLWFIHRLRFCTISFAYICIALQGYAFILRLALSALTLQLIFIITGCDCWCNVPLNAAIIHTLPFPRMSSRLASLNAMHFIFIMAIFYACDLGQHYAQQ